MKKISEIVIIQAIESSVFLTNSIFQKFKSDHSDRCLFFICCISCKIYDIPSSDWVHRLCYFNNSAENSFYMWLYYYQQQFMPSFNAILFRNVWLNALRIDDPCRPTTAIYCRIYLLATWVLNSYLCPAVTLLSSEIRDKTLWEYTITLLRQFTANLPPRATWVPSSCLPQLVLCCRWETTNWRDSFCTILSQDKCTCMDHINISIEKCSAFELKI